MATVDEAIRRLPPERQAEVIEFVEFLLAKHARTPRRPMKCDWAGGVRDLREQYTSVELQHEASTWRDDDPVSRFEHG